MTNETPTADRLLAQTHALADAIATYAVTSDNAVTRERFLGLAQAMRDAAVLTTCEDCEARIATRIGYFGLAQCEVCEQKRAPRYEPGPDDDAAYEAARDRVA